MATTRSPFQRTCFATRFVRSLNTRLLLESEFPADVHENRDLELQSPVTGSFLVSEKNGDFSSPPDAVSHVDLGRPASVRKYSRDWWQANWNVAVAHRVWPRVLYMTFGLLVIVVWIGTT